MAAHGRLGEVELQGVLAQALADVVVPAAAALLGSAAPACSAACDRGF